MSERPPETRAEPITPRAEAWLLAAVIAAYCALQCRHFLVPGIVGDEAFDAVLTLDIVQNLFHPIGHWPLLLTDYHTALQSYLLAPFFLLIREPAVALRAAEVCFGAAVLLAAYFCVREFFNKTVAFLTVLFLAGNPAFFYMSRIGVMMGSVMSAFSMTALGLLHLWHRKGGDRRLLAAAFLLGVGSCVKIWFFWLPAALLVLGALHWKELRPRLGRRALCGGALLFALGSSFRWLPEALDGHRTAAYISSHFLRTGLADNLSVFDNLQKRWGDFMNILGGVVLDPEGMVPPDSPLADYRFPFRWSFLVLLSAAVLLFLRRESRELGRAHFTRARFFSILILAMFSFSLYTVSVFRQDHLLILFPFPQILLALAAFSGFHVLASPKGGRRTADAIAAAVFLGLLSVSLLSNLLIFYESESALERTGGEAEMSDATFAMTAWLEANGLTQPKFYLMRIDSTVRLLSRRRISPRLCGDEAFATGKTRGWFFPTCLDGGDNIFIFAAPSLSTYNWDYNYPWVARLVRERGGRLALRKIFFRRNGAAAFLAYARQPR